MDDGPLSVGQRFDKEFKNAVANQDVFLPVITQRWLNSLRIQSAQIDYMHQQIAGALRRGLIVIPVVIDEADLLGTVLPEDIRDILRYPHFVIRLKNFNPDMDALIAAIAKVGGWKAQYQKRRLGPRMPAAITMLLGILVLLSVGPIGYFVFGHSYKTTSASEPDHSTPLPLSVAQTDTNPIQKVPELPSATARAEAKIALLIGNQTYDPSVGVLKNPLNDISVVGEALARQGFEVLPPIKNAKRSAILGAVRKFVDRLKTVGPNAIGFLYYSGHGAAEKDTNINYLIPVDAKEPGTAAFWDESLKLDDVLKLLDGAQWAAKFIVFDACRNELRLPTKDTTKGLVPVAEQQGMFIAFASAPGRAASDRGEGSGPYAAALAAELGKPGLDHLNLFQNVKEAVLAATGGAQQPWESNGLGRRVYLTGPAQTSDATSQISNAATSQSMGNSQPDGVPLYCGWHNDVASVVVDVDYATKRVAFKLQGTEAMTVEGEITDYDINWMAPAPKNTWGKGFSTSPIRFRINRLTGVLVTCGGVRADGDPGCSDPQQCVPRNPRF
jgi:hypothetical protein